MDYLHLFGYAKAAEAGSDYDITFVCSTDVADREGDVIDQDGWELDNFRRNPVFLAAHTHRLDNGHSPVIGSFPELAVETVDGHKALVGHARFASTELGCQYKTLYVEEQHMVAVSVGFMPTVEPQPIKGSRGRRYPQNELYEISAVAVPCNQEALAMRAARGDGQVRRDLEQPSALDADEARRIAGDLAAKIERLDAIIDRIEEYEASLDARMLGLDDLAADDHDHDHNPNDERATHAAKAGRASADDAPDRDETGHGADLQRSIRDLIDGAS